MKKPTYETLHSEPISTPVDPTTAPEKGSVALSVVIIAENEAEHIEGCIESVFDACRTVPTFEVILVDSASTDRTVELAEKYPITILRIPDEHTVSCGAGRYVGDQVATGEMVLHIDSDMTLTETWLPRAIEFMRTHEDVVAIEGCLDESTQTEVREVNKVGGVMLYDTHALAAIGGFDPYLVGHEDIDVGFQLKMAGHRLVRLPDVSAIHHDEGAITEPIRRWRQGYEVARGQVIRKHLDSPPVLKWMLSRQRYQLALIVWVCVGTVSLFFTPLLVGWLLLSVVGFGFVVSKRGLSGAIKFFGAKAFGIAGIVVGFRKQPRSAEEFPLSAVEVLTTGRIFEGETESLASLGTAASDSSSVTSE